MSANEVVSRLKERGYCQCGDDRCSGTEPGNPLYGTLGRPDKANRRHVTGCPCARCRGRRNKRKGQRKQAKATTALGIPRSSLHPGHEEFLGGTVRVECKAGGRMANPVWTRFRDCEAQSEASRPIGDHRPFAALFMPDGQSDGLVVVKLSQVYEFAAAIVEMWGQG